MALNGKIQTNSIMNRYYTLEWSATQSIPNNNSIVYWVLSANGVNGWVAEHSLTVTINGEKVINRSGRYERYNGYIGDGYITIPHNVDGTQTFSASINATVYSTSQKCVGSNTFTLDPIARYATLTEAPDFNDEATSVTISYSNPSGNSITALDAYIEFVSPYYCAISPRAVSKTAKSYTFTFTDAERKALRKGVTSGGSATVKFVIRTTIEDLVYYKVLVRTFTLIDYEPTISPVVADMNDTTLALTGDYRILIKYFSTAACTFNAEAKKEATISTYEIKNGAKTANKNVSAIYNVETPVFTFTATDSRGNKATDTVTTGFVEYFKPTCNQEITLELDGETTAKASFTITGTAFKGSFGAVDNALDVQIRHTDNNGDFVDWISVSDLIWETYWDENNEFRVTGNVTGLAYDKTHSFQSRVIDKLSNSETTEYSIKLIPVFDWSETDFNFNVPVAIQGNELKDYVIENGTTAMGSNGTWYWEKWASGKATCYGTRNFGNMAINTAVGSLYESASFNQALPYDLFVAAPDYASIFVVSCNNAMTFVIHSSTKATKDDIGSFRVFSPQSITAQQVTIAFHAIGRWK